MRRNTITKLISVLVLSMASVSVTSNVMAQVDSIAFRDQTNRRADSLLSAYDKQKLEAAREKKIADEKRNDAINLSDLKGEKEDTKAIAKEAQRVEGEANDAARESKNAYRTEKKAQKARKQADKQAVKAEKARRKSNSN